MIQDSAAHPRMLEIVEAAEVRRVIRKRLASVASGEPGGTLTRIGRAGMNEIRWFAVAVGAIVLPCLIGARSASPIQVSGIGGASSAEVGSDAAQILRVHHSMGRGEPYDTCVVWADGYYAYSTQVRAPDGEYSVVTGQLPPDSLDDLQERFGGHALFNCRVRSYLVPDAGHTQVEWTSGDAVMDARWDGVVWPRYGANTTGSEDYRQFVRSWHDAAVVLCVALSSGQVDDSTTSERPGVVVRDATFGPGGGSLFSIPSAPCDE